MRFAAALLATSLMSVSASAFAADQMFAPEEFGKVADAAVAQFKSEMPQHLSMFYGVALTRIVQGGQEVGVLAKIYTSMGGSAPSVMSKYNCAKADDGAIQCHPAD